MTPTELLAVYDAQLRIDAPSADSVTRLGPLHLVTFPAGRGYVTYGPPDVDLASLVPEALEHFRAQPQIRRIEWKTRGHDDVAGLHDALLEAGFVPEETESILLGEVAGLAADVPLPTGVTLRRLGSEADLRTMSAMSDEAFGDPVSGERAEGLLRRASLDDGTEFWVAEADGVMVSAGRLEPVPGTDVAGIWGGGTLPDWRRRGIYRALLAVRARSALALSKTLVHSDSTEDSRPILERLGLVTVSTTTPYEWRRP